MHCQLPCIAKHVLYSCLRTLKYRTLEHLSFTNTIQTLRILKPLCQPAPGTAAATRPCSQITLGRLVYSLYSIHCNCIVLNSTIVTYNYSLKLFLISSDTKIKNFKKFGKFANFNEFKKPVVTNSQSMLPVIKFALEIAVTKRKV